MTHRHPPPVAEPWTTRTLRESRHTSELIDVQQRESIEAGHVSREVHFDTTPPLTGGPTNIRCGAQTYTAATATTPQRIEQSTRWPQQTTCPKCIELMKGDEK